MRRSLKLSIVTSLYKSESYLDDFFRRAKNAAEQITNDYEIILVNDGSPDGSLAKCKGYFEAGEPAHIVDLTRNHGHHVALLAGMERARGDYVFLIDSDLEEDPELLVKFWEIMGQHPEVDVVLGMQRARKGSWSEKHFDGMFYTVFNALSDVPIQRNCTTVRLMRQRYVNHLCQFSESDVFLPGLVELAGYNQMAVPIDKGERGESTYNLSRKIAITLAGVTSFSAKPLELIFVMGAMISALSFLGITWIIYAKLVLHQGILGWTSVIVSVWLLGGLTLSSLGVIGIYVARIFRQVKQRPRVLVREECIPAARPQIAPAKQKADAGA